MDDLARALVQAEGRVERDAVLAPLTTYRLGGPAALLFEPASVADLDLLTRVVGARGPEASPILVLGRGSNLVVSDAGWPGLVVRIGSPFADLTMDGRYIVGAGASMPTVANAAARRGLAGVEFMVAIPGSIGGGVRMNAGAHDADMAAVLVRARIMSLTAGEVADVDAADLGLAYRTSRVGDHDVVVHAELSLHEDDPRVVTERVAAYRRHRAATQPGAAQNAGSVFRNPPGDHAGRLVEAAGLKGFRVGAARVSHIHANFFIADAGATAMDVKALVDTVRDRVRDTFGVELVPEIRFVGDFTTTMSTG